MDQKHTVIKYKNKYTDLTVILTQHLHGCTSLVIKKHQLLKTFHCICICIRNVLPLNVHNVFIQEILLPKPSEST